VGGENDSLTKGERERKHGKKDNERTSRLSLQQKRRRKGGVGKKKDGGAPNWALTES